MYTKPIDNSESTSATLRFVRHGGTECNRRDVVQGAGVDRAIDDARRAYTEALARQLASVSVDRGCASMRRRARQTACIAAAPHQPITTSCLRSFGEMRWGVFEDEPPSEDRNAAMGAMKDRWRTGRVQ